MQERSDHHTSVKAIADALRDLADRLDSTPVRDLPPLWLQVSLQAVRRDHRGGAWRDVPLEERRAAVDTLAAHLDLPQPREDGTYRTDRRICGASVNVYTGNGEANQ